MIVRDVEYFNQLTRQWGEIIACDTETALDAHLLGVSLSNGYNSFYVPIKGWNGTSFEMEASNDLLEALKSILTSKSLVGHNFTYDKHWVEKELGITTSWVFCTRIGWHLASAPAGPRPYGLKDAQVECLGWSSANDKELDNNVRSKGGSLKKGEHYLADLSVLGKYAALDALSTYKLYEHLLPFFKEHDYFEMVEIMMQYNLLLDENTRTGVKTNVEGLKKVKELFESKRDKAYTRFKKTFSKEIAKLEDAWRDRKVSNYKRDYNKIRYLSHPEEWKRFNPNSDKDKRELFFDLCKFPVVETTEAGLPSTSGKSLATNSQLLGDYLEYEHYNTLISNFISPYITCTERTGYLHPGFNICGTVSYRLSGFKPYLLNAPFEEKQIMCNFMCEEGWEGVHADLSAVEPTITAHYSQDPALLKVFKEGLGDIYLDLALELFPDDEELKNGYNPRIPITGAVKERFSRQRKISKVIQLAVQYTGTGHTVAKNLSFSGFPTTPEAANVYVRRYWRKFRKVAEWQWQLRCEYKRRNLLRNAIGRVIRVPDPDYKDLPNRFIQSSAHDVLVLWVLRIYKICSERGLQIRPVLLDCHDSTSNATLSSNGAVLEGIYRESLEQVSNELGLSVPVRFEIKRFKSLAGLKGKEDD